MTVSKIRLNGTDHDIRAKYLVPSSEATPTEHTISSTTTSGVSQDMGEGIATISKIKGNTITWNQQNAKKDNSGTASSSGVLIGNSVSGMSYQRIAGHKYLFRVKLLTLSSSDVAYPMAGAVTVGIKTNEVWSYIYTSTITQTRNATFELRSYGTGTFGWSDLCVFDLTAMYGSGNEPTIEQFEAQYPASYYSYDAGSLYGTTATGIKSVNSDSTKTSICNLNITSLKGKLNGTGSSVTIFPNGVHKNGTTYDELLSTTAIKRVADDNTVLSSAQTYTLDTPLNLSYASFYGGTESILPVQNPTITSAPLDALISYSAGDVQALMGSQVSSISNDSLKNLLDAMVTAGVISAYTMVYNSDTGKYDFTITA